MSFISRQDWPDFYETPKISKSCESCLVKILACPIADTIERFLDVLDRIGYAETQVTFTEMAKRCPGQASNASVIEKRVRQFLRLPTRFRNVGENVKRT